MRGFTGFSDLPEIRSPGDWPGKSHLNRPPRRFGGPLARSAFGAFILQGPVLISLMLLLRPLAVSEIKALVVACAGVTLSFVLAWLLVSRTPVGRIL